MDGSIECLFGQFACILWWTHNFIIEHWVIKSKSKSNWMSCLQFLCLFLCLLVWVLCTINNWFSLVSLLEFTKISKVITLHLLEEYDGLWVGRSVKKFLFQQIQYVKTQFLQFFFNFFFVFFNQRKELVLLQLFLVPDGLDCSPCVSSCFDWVFVGDTQQISLIVREFSVEISNFFHVLDHVFVSLSLLT